MENEDVEETIMSSVNDLLTAISNRNFDQDYIQEDIQYVNERFDKFRKYFNSVYEHVYGSSTSLTLVHGGMMTPEAYQDMVVRLDGKRKQAHDMAIVACGQINRQCDTYGLEHLCPEVIEDERDHTKCANRGEIADFVGRYMYSVYQQGREGRNMDQLIIDNDIKYGDRPALDVSYEVAKDSGRNPETAYKETDMDKEAYDNFSWEHDEPGDIVPDVTEDTAIDNSNIEIDEDIEL